MKVDEYGEVINGQATYDEIVANLVLGRSIMIGWTDEQMSHFDILFSFRAGRYGSQIQGGLRPETDLLVSIMRVGAFGFEVNASELHPGYVGEKLFMSGTTCEKLTELINGVKKELIKHI